MLTEKDTKFINCLYGKSNKFNPLVTVKRRKKGSQSGAKKNILSIICRKITDIVNFVLECHEWVLGRGGGDHKFHQSEVIIDVTISEHSKVALIRLWKIMENISDKNF